MIKQLYFCLTSTSIFILKNRYLDKNKLNKLKTLKHVPDKANTNIKQALFVGSSAELHKMLKNKNTQVQSEEDKDFKKVNPDD